MPNIIISFPLKSVSIRISFSDKSKYASFPQGLLLINNVIKKSAIFFIYSSIIPIKRFAVFYYSIKNRYLSMNIPIIATIVIITNVIDTT